MHTEVLKTENRLSPATSAKGAAGFAEAGKLGCFGGVTSHSTVLNRELGLGTGHLYKRVLEVTL